MRNPAVIGITAVVLLCSGLNVPEAVAQEKFSDALMATELRALTSAVEKLSAQLGGESGLTSQETTLRKLDIAVAYLNFRSRRIEMFERELQTMRSSRNRLEDTFEQLRQEEDNLARAFGSGQPDITLKAREDLRFRRKVVRDRIERFDSEIVMLENRILEMQHQLDSVESFVQKNMKF